jgi:hypothetical protein
MVERSLSMREAPGSIPGFSKRKTKLRSIGDPVFLHPNDSFLPTTSFSTLNPVHLATVPIWIHPVTGYWWFTGDWDRKILMNPNNFTLTHILDVDHRLGSSRETSSDGRALA